MSLDSAFAELPEYRTNQERIATQLREAILSGGLPQGARVTQNELATRMGASITPVREAVRQLAGEGLLRIAPNTRVTVAVPTAQDTVDVYELLMILEPLAMQKAAGQISKADVARAQRAIDAMADLGDAVGRWSLLNCEFHDALATASGSEPLAQTLRALRRRGALYVSASLRVPHRLPDSAKQHEAILAAVAAGQSARASDLALEHLRATLTALRIDPLS